MPLAAGYDLILVSTAHDEYSKLDFSVFKAPVVDTRHVAKGAGAQLHQA